MEGFLSRSFGLGALPSILTFRPSSPRTRPLIIQSRARGELQLRCSETLPISPNDWSWGSANGRSLAGRPWPLSDWLNLSSFHCFTPGTRHETAASRNARPKCREWLPTSALRYPTSPHPCAGLYLYISLYVTETTSLRDTAFVHWRYSLSSSAFVEGETEDSWELSATLEAVLWLSDYPCVVPPAPLLPPHEG